MNLREIRKHRGLTQEKLEEITGINQGVISNLELGKIRYPSWDVVARLSRALDVAPEELFPVDPPSRIASEKKGGFDEARLEGTHLNEFHR